MASLIKIIRKVDVEKEYLSILEFELDYLLASLYVAMEENDEKEKSKLNSELSEVQTEIERIQLSLTSRS